MKYRKKPVEIYAMQFKKDRWDASAPPDFHEAVLVAPNTGGHPAYYFIKTLEGKMDVRENDWIIKGVKGEFYPCKPDIFEMSYEKVDE